MRTEIVGEGHQKYGCTGDLSIDSWNENVSDQFYIEQKKKRCKERERRLKEKEQGILIGDETQKVNQMNRSNNEIKQRQKSYSYSDSDLESSEQEDEDEEDDIDESSSTEEEESENSQISDISNNLKMKNQLKEKDQQLKSDLIIPHYSYKMAFGEEQEEDDDEIQDEDGAEEIDLNQFRSRWFQKRRERVQQFDRNCQEYEEEDQVNEPDIQYSDEEAEDNNEDIYDNDGAEEVDVVYNQKEQNHICIEEERIKKRKDGFYKQKSISNNTPSWKRTYEKDASILKKGEQH
ncbi:MAG: hypothetical protein EZS28_000484 [Streblomastix strix]|uniref:Uncharacterized protein n=1 Tax=Streblomastix strix TaxID=222440 RepID=A0A5J4XBT8_9EUKA|nr:MAG: hypothetical protein EZS28_000484 [Streblomastix strix]